VEARGRGARYEAVRIEVEVVLGAAAATGSSVASEVSLCSPGSGCSWLMLISRLKRNSPLLGLVRLTARHVWLPLCPLRVALPVRRNVFSHSSNESPLEDSAPGSGAPVKNTQDQQSDHGKEPFELKQRHTLLILPSLTAAYSTLRNLFNENDTILNDVLK